MIPRSGPAAPTTLRDDRRRASTTSLDRTPRGRSSLAVADPAHTAEFIAMLTEERDLVASKLGGDDLDDELPYLDQLIAQLRGSRDYRV